jgi:erythritol transport system ATP-binding protein
VRPDAILEARGITRRYPGTVALDRVDYTLYRSKVNVLVGENGAGKSTLMRVLAGIETPDAGEIHIDGDLARLHSPRDAARHGIAIVHQELSVLPNLTVSANIFAGREPVKAGILLDQSSERKRTASVLERLRMRVGGQTQAGRLPLGVRQLVEIARTLDQQAKVLILDEPTSALSNAEAEQLFTVIEELKQAGVTLVYISHRLSELLHLGDHFTVLRGGRKVGEAERGEVTRQWIVEKMSGRSLTPLSGAYEAGAGSASLLQVDGLSLAAERGEESRAGLDNISFSLNRGEVLGIYGLLGAGRSELMECLAGLRKRTAGSVRLGGSEVKGTNVREAVNAGIHLVPEDRQRDGLVPELSILENIALDFCHGPLLKREDERREAQHLARELNLAAGSLDLSVMALSGGNQQKVLIARCLMRKPKLLLLDEPTRGVDVRAKAEIYAILRKLAREGIGVIFTSSEIEEVQALADRVLVLCQGRIVAEMEGEAIRDDAFFDAASPRVSDRQARVQV